MEQVTSIAELPSVAAVYALYGGRGATTYTAYVGVADQLKRRITQHLVRRDSALTSGTSAYLLNPEYVTALHWWTHDGFARRPVLEAAGLVALDVLEPALRTPPPVTEDVRRVHYRPRFRQQMRALFRGAPAGRLQIPTLTDALERIRVLEQRLEAVERRRP